MFHCTIIVPCYNESERLPTDTFAAFMDQHPEIAFLFVYDGSTDSTLSVLQMLCVGRHNAGFMQLPSNSGKAEAVRLGILKAAENDTCGSYLGFWDADLSTSLDEIPRFLNFAGAETLMISGCRLRRLGGEIDRTLTRHILGRIFATVISNYLKLPVYDTQCGAKLYKKAAIVNAVSQPFVTKWFFDVEILKRLTAAYELDTVRHQCCEVPLTRWLEVSGSKIRYLATLKDFLKLLFSR